MHVKVQVIDKSQPFPYVQLGTLALCRLAEPIALASVLPYAYSMVKSFHFGDDSNAGFWSGILVSSFAVCEASVCPLWGTLSDKIGRKPVLLIGMAGTMISILMMGFASNFWFALAARSFGGMLNGNIGVIQTIVGEICKNPDHMPRAFGMMPIVWLLGTIIGPSIAAFSIGKVFPDLPYLLPNMICAFILLIAIIAGWFLLEETHPELMAKPNTVIEAAVATEIGGSYGTFARNDSAETLAPADQTETSSLLDKIRGAEESNDIVANEGPLFTKRILMLFAALAFFAYHAMCFDHLLPILLVNDRAPATDNGPALPTGGLGFSQQQVGMLMSFNGALALLVQIVLFPPLAARVGVFRLFQLSVLIHPLVYLLPPLLPALPASPVWITWAGLLVELVIRNLSTIVLYPLLLILIKEAAPSPSVLGRINGVAASCGSFPRALSPPIAGYFFGVGESHGIPGLAWWTTAIVAVLACVQMAGIKPIKQIILDDVDIQEAGLAVTDENLTYQGVSDTECDDTFDSDFETDEATQTMQRSHTTKKRRTSVMIAEVDSD